jgi:hypothetical protein
MPFVSPFREGADPGIDTLMCASTLSPDDNKNWYFVMLYGTAVLFYLWQMWLRAKTRNWDLNRQKTSKNLRMQSKKAKEEAKRNKEKFNPTVSYQSLKDYPPEASINSESFEPLLGAVVDRYASQKGGHTLEDDVYQTYFFSDTQSVFSAASTATTATTATTSSQRKKKAQKLPDDNASEYILEPEDPRNRTDLEEDIDESFITKNQVLLALVIFSGLIWLLWLVFLGYNFSNALSTLSWICFVLAEMINYLLGIVSLPLHSSSIFVLRFLISYFYFAAVLLELLASKDQKVEVSGQLAAQL